MGWPLSHEFNESVQNPQIAFNDPELKSTSPVVGAQGLPLPRSGNFADVYQLKGSDGRDWAVKCFTRPVVGLAERYARVSEALEQANLPFTIHFTFLAEGIRVGSAWFPIVKMEWVEGLLLNQVVRENIARPNVLNALTQMWVKLCKRLREAKITHADLQHGNVLMVPGSRPGAYGLKLIDYDGMYIPALVNKPSGESGHSSYQHPARAATRAYSPDVDRFPNLVVATALKGLAVCGPSLWERYDNGDNLLFTEDDFKKPSASRVMRELWQTENPDVQSLVGRLAIACGKPIPQTPWLDELAPDGEPAPLDDATRREAETALGISQPLPLPAKPKVEVKFEIVEAPKAKSVPAPLPLPEEAPFSLPDDDPPKRSSARKAKKPKKSAREQSSNNKMVLFAAGVPTALLAVALVIIIVLMNRGSAKPKPEEITEVKPVVQVKQEETKLPEQKVPELKLPEPKVPEPKVPEPAAPEVNNPDADRKAAEYVISAGGTIAYEQGRGTRQNVRQVPDGPFRLTGISFMYNTRVTDAGLACFKHCGNLTEITIDTSAVAVSDAGLANFQHCKNLVLLNLQCERVTDVGLANFKDCKKLQKLILYRMRNATDAGLANFKDCKELKHLIVGDIPFTDAVFANFKDCTELTNLSFVVSNNARLTDAGLAHFKNCKELRMLNLHNAKAVTDAGLAHFANCKHMETMFLDTGITGAGLSFMKEFKELRTITIIGRQFTNDGMAHLKECPNLKQLTLREINLAEAGMAHLKEFKLDILTVSPSKQTDAWLAHIKDMKTLTSLELHGADLTDAGLEHIKGLANLRGLYIQGTKVTAKGVEEFRTAVPNCKVYFR